MKDIRQDISGTDPSWSTSHVELTGGRHGRDGAIIVRNIPGSIYAAVRRHVTEMIAVVS